METAIEGGVVWWVAPDFPRAKIAWRMIIKLCTQIPGIVVNKGEAIILFPGGGYIQLKSAVNPDSLRGEGLHLVVIDECADVPEIAWSEALRPTLTDFQGKALFIGTPKGRNWFHTLWQNAHKLPGWAAFQMPTSTNPYIPIAEIAAAKRELPDRSFRQEYLAEFVTFAGRVYENFDPNGKMVFSDLDLDRYHTFWAGIDFGYRNPTAIVVAGEDEDSRLDVIDEVYERGLLNQEVVDIGLDLTEKYDIRQWWGDSANPELIQEMQNAGIPIEPSPRTSGGQGSFVQWEIRLVAGKLEEQPNPSLRFHDSCEVTIKEHDNYAYAKTRHGSEDRETPVKVNDHSCFPPGTMISTPGGQKPIESLKTGDRLLTHRGIGSILGIAVTGKQELVRLKLDCGRWVVCTADHPIAISGGGFATADDCLGLEVDTWQTRKQLTMGGTPGGDIPNRLIIRSGNISEGLREKDQKESCSTSFSTSRSTGTILGIYRPGSIFITKTGTLATTAQKILRRSALRTTQSTTITSWTQRPGRHVLPGTERQRVLSGTGSIGSIQLGELKRYLKIASIAELNSRQRDAMQNSAHQIARQNTGEKAVSITKLESALSVVRRLSAIATRKRGLAREDVEPSLVIEVERLTGRWPVINMAVSDGAYFANGILVSNCNATQYLCHGLGEWYGWDAGAAVSAGTREAQNLPGRR